MCCGPVSYCPATGMVFCQFHVYKCDKWVLSYRLVTTFWSSACSTWRMAMSPGHSLATDWFSPLARNRRLWVTTGLTTGTSGGHNSLGGGAAVITLHRISTSSLQQQSTPTSSNFYLQCTLRQTSTFKCCFSSVELCICTKSV